MVDPADSRSSLESCLGNVSKSVELLEQRVQKHLEMAEVHMGRLSAIMLKAKQLGELLDQVQTLMTYEDLLCPECQAKMHLLGMLAASPGDDKLHPAFGSGED